VEILQGTVDVLILRALAWESMHGYAISRWIHDRSSEALAVEGAALYQALHRLERKKLISATWGASENNRRAKYYELTTDGKRHLRSETQAWRAYASAVSRVLEPT
jgi:PadR family transcriptional regulator